MITMKLFFLILALTKSESPSSLKQITCPLGTTSIGQECESNPEVFIAAFCIAVWPPIPTMIIAAHIYVIFSNPVYLNEIVMGTCLNNVFWTYTLLDYGKTMTTSILVDIEIFFPFPSKPGSYMSNVQLISSQHAGCWQFSYIID